MRTWHSLEIEGQENLPPRGPALLLVNHVSFLDVPALMALDPYPDSTLLALASLFRVPLVRQLLKAWDAIPVKRRGQDTASIGALIGAIRAGRVVGIAVEGERSRSGRLGPVHPVLSAIAASLDAPVVPVGIVGTFDAMPRGAFLPRRKKIVLRIGEPYTLENLTAAEAAERIRQSIAALLPPHQRPLSGLEPGESGDNARQS
jgi:1-acyl-sn-glycerol-3-phosphate acyltransferase